MLAEIKNRIERHVADNQFTLNQKSTGCSEVGSLLHFIDSSQGLSLRDVRLSPLSSPRRPQGQYFSLSGTGDFWCLKNAQITATFTETDSNRTDATEIDPKALDTIHVGIEATPPATWSFITGFPALPHSYGIQESILYALTIRRAEFSLERAGVDHHIQLTIELQAALEGPLAFLKAFTEGDHISLSGIISLDQPTPMIELQGGLKDGIHFDPFVFGSPQLSLKTALDKSISLFSQLRIKATLSWGDQLSVALEGEWPHHAGGLSILSTAEDSKFALSSLTDILASFPITPADGLEAVLSFTHFDVDQLMIGLIPERLELVSFALQLSIDNEVLPITIPGQSGPLFTLEELWFQIAIQYPSDAALRQLSFTVNGQTQLFGKHFKASLNLPGPIGDIRLEQGEIKLSEILSQTAFLPDGFSAVGLPQTDFALTDMTINLNVPAHSFYFSSKISGHASIPIPGTGQAVTIQNPALRIRSFLRNPELSMLAFAGQVDIAGLPADINMILSPKSFAFSSSVTHVSLLKLIESQLGQRVALPDWELERAFVSFGQSSMHLSGHLNTNDLEDTLTIGRCAINFDQLLADVQTSAQQIYVRLSGRARLGRTALQINTALRDAAFNFAGTITRLDMAHLLDDLFGVSLGDVNLTVEALDFSITNSGRLSLNAQKIQFRFHQLAQDLGFQLPDGLSNIELTHFDAQVNGRTASMVVKSDMVIPFADGVVARNFAVTLAHSPDAGMSFGLGFDLIGRNLELVEGCFLDVALNCRGVVNGPSKLEGKASITLFDAAPIALTARLIQGGASQHLALTYENRAVPLINTPDVFVFHLQKLTLQYSHGEQGAQFDLRAETAFAIASLPEIKAQLSFDTLNGKRQIILKADTDPLPLPAITFPNIGAASAPPAIGLALSDIELRYGGGSRGSGASGRSNGDQPSQLELKAKSHVALSAFAPFDALLGSEHEGVLTVNAKSLSVSCRISDANSQIAGPAFDWRPGDDGRHGENRQSTLSPHIAIRTFGFEIRQASGPQLTSEWRVTVPPNLNQQLGINLFSPEFDLVFNLGEAITLTPNGKPNWPLAALTTETIDNQEWIRLGELIIAIPVFQFKSGEWSVSGVKIRGLRKFGIPLTPLKFLLKCCQVPESFYKVFPDTFPLGDIQLRVDSLPRDIPNLIGASAAEQIDGLLKGLGTRLSKILTELSRQAKKLPAHLLQYLTFDPPDALALDIGVTTSGGTNVAFRVDPDHPVRLLLPFPGLPPGLLGVTLREIKIGQCAGGQLLLLGFDGHIDRFDFLTLLAAVASPKGGTHYVNRITLNKVLAVAPTALPVPIPLLYDEIAWDYRDIFDFELHSHFSNVLEEELGLTLLLEMIVTLRPFFIDPDFLLHAPGNMPDATKMKFTIGENMLRFPSYLGGGDQQGITALRPYNMTQSMAYLLDALKKLNVAYAIKSIPLFIPHDHSRAWIRVRQLKSSLAIGPFELGAQAAWCIATEDELVGPIAAHAVEDGVIDEDSLADVGLALPKGTAFSDRGFVIFAMGGAELKPLIGLHCQFALAYTHAQGFQTGVRVKAMLATFELTIGGTLQITDTQTQIEGGLKLELPSGAKRIKILSSSGAITVTQKPMKQFKVMVSGGVGKVGIAGSLTVQPNLFEMKGSLNWPLGEFSTGKAKISFGEQEIEASCSGKLQAVEGAFRFYLIDQQVTMSLALSDDFQNQIHDAIVNIANHQVNTALDEASEELQNALRSIKKYEGSVLNLRKKTVPKVCNTALSEIARRIKAEAAKRCKSRIKWYRDACKARVIKAANRGAKPYRAKLTRLRTAAARGSQREVVNAANDLIALAGKKLYGYTVLDQKNKSMLQRLINQYAAINENMKIKGANEKVLSQFSEFDKMLSNIRRKVTGAMDGMVPHIEALTFELSLAQAVPEAVTGTLVFRGAQPLAIQVYPRDPAKTSLSIAHSLREVL